MATFSLTTIIESTDEVVVDVEKAIAEFHKALASLHHKVTKATLTGDAGQTKLSVPEPVVAEPVVKAPVTPAPVAKTAAPTKSTLDLLTPVKSPTWGE